MVVVRLQHFFSHLMSERTRTIKQLLVCSGMFGVVCALECWELYVYRNVWIWYVYGNFWSDMCMGIFGYGMCTGMFLVVCVQECWEWYVYRNV